MTTICGKGQVLENLELLEPFNVVKVWGGRKLAGLKNMVKELEAQNLLPLGETWEVSRHHEGSSQTQGGQNLSELLDEEEMPYLVKFIDTTDNLSIQVHPDDQYARKVENSSGKTECWLILESDPEGGIYLGFKKGVTKEQFKKVLDEKGNLSELMVFYPVKRGDFFFVPAGTIHAIGKGVTLAEIQQNSGITYRVWDWNRVDIDGRPRELHIDKALDVINFDSQFNKPENFRIKKEVLNQENGLLIDHDDFTVTLVTLENGETYELKETFLPRKRAILCLSGHVRCLNKTIGSYRAALFSQQQSYKLQAGEELSKTIFLIIS